MNATALLRLLHFASPALPIGAFAYSQGLEAAVHAGLVTDPATAEAWILGLLGEPLRTTDVPLFGRLRAAFAANHQPRADALVAELHALRGSHELQEEERRLGVALARALGTLGVPVVATAKPSYVAMFALAAAHYGLDEADAAAAFLFTWCENQAAALMRLLPIGQSAGLRILDAAIAVIPTVVSEGLALPDDEIGMGAPMHALVSARHETQYSRIFRS